MSVRPPCNSSRKGAMRSVQATRGARTRSCSRSPNLAPNSNVSESSPSTSRAGPREDTKQSLPLVTDTVPFETEKGHWTQEDCEGPHSRTNGASTLSLRRPSALGSTEARKGIAHISSPHCVLQQGPAQVSQSFSELLVLQIRHI